MLKYEHSVHPTAIHGESNKKNAFTASIHSQKSWLPLSVSYSQSLTLLHSQFFFSRLPCSVNQLVFFKLGFHFTKLYWGEPIEKTAEAEGVSIFFVLFDDTLDI